MSKTWFITGCSRGFGWAFAEAALLRGDKVVATARKVSTLAPLAQRFGPSCLTLTLDVTQRDAVFATLQQAHRHFGRLDVVVNNAGYGQFGFIEELNEAEVRAQMESNFFGALWVSQAAAPLLRMQGHGHIVQISSIAGVVTFPSMGLYNASKWALEGFSEALAQELEPFAVHVTLVEPSAFATDWSKVAATPTTTLPLYDEARAALLARLKRATPGDPRGAARELLALVDNDDPPLRLLFGAKAYQRAVRITQQRLDEWAAYKDVAVASDRA